MDILRKPLVLATSLALSTLIVGCGSSSSSNDNDTPAAKRLKSVTSSVMNGGGELLIDSDAKLTWINDTLDRCS